MSINLCENTVFSSRLKAYREKRGLSQVDLASRAGLPSTSISHFESGARKPSFDNLVRLVRALEVSADYLLGLSSLNQTNHTVERLSQQIQDLTLADLNLIESFIQMLRQRGTHERAS